MLDSCINVFAIGGADAACFFLLDKFGKAICA
jgi:hypothetical protein